ncbi:hypothetical protein GIB67_025732 [Kingdonia uniflora]|uniref:Aldehyde dehydrogenase domain-containing protein n=1 Tax=Kingdonia uniflora TaxID=39325 RepID=A0A7J7MYP0_9MAGN|nr:hypothetical protein GIB67_025732 [Kingdonia uniflora]
MLNYGGSGGMDFSGIDVALHGELVTVYVEVILGFREHVIALVALVIYVERWWSQLLDVLRGVQLCMGMKHWQLFPLQYNVKAAINEGANWYNRFMSLTEVIMELVVTQSLVKSIQQVVDEEGSVRDSVVRLLLLAFRFQLRNALHFKSLQLLILVGNSNLKRSQDQVQVLERKLNQLMDSLIRDDLNGTTTLWHRKNLLKAKKDVSNAITVGILVKSLNLTLSNLDQWMVTTKTRLPLVFFPATGEVLPEPLGVVLIPSSWNYPISLALDPLIGAIAAGNAVVLKPSELAPACSALLVNTIPSYMNDKAPMVVEGGASVGKQLLDQKWDKIFFTAIEPIFPRVFRSDMHNLVKDASMGPLRERFWDKG